MQKLVGYKLVDTKTGETIEQWCGEWTWCPDIPNPLILPNGDAIFGVKPGGQYGDYRLDQLMMDEPAPQAPEEISDRQFFQQLAVNKAITEQEALDAVKTGAIPAAIEAFVDTLPDEQKFAAQMLLSGATVFKRSHPMTAMLGAGLGMEDAEINAIWLAASQL